MYRRHTNVFWLNGPAGPSLSCLIKILETLTPVTSLILHSHRRPSLDSLLFLLSSLVRFDSLSSSATLRPTQPFLPRICGELLQCAAVAPSCSMARRADLRCGVRADPRRGGRADPVRWRIQLLQGSAAEPLQGATAGGSEARRPSGS